ncbi:hypothetical protein [Tumidithrix elongata]|uniref:hypothetical protein n=1 Tax=Tumidithrix elongata TaxID=3088357 RepID=UPI002ED516D8
MAIVSVILKKDFNFIVSDGRYYYAYLPSAIVDFDFDFTNQITENWGVDFTPALLEQKTPIGLVRNKYTIGLALSLAPVFVFAHLVSSLLYKLTGLSWFLPNGYSSIYQLSGLISIQLYGLFTFCLIDRFLRKQLKFDKKVILLGIIFVWVGSHYSYYYFREPFMVHVVSAFWVTTTILISFQCLLNSPINPQNGSGVVTDNFSKKPILAIFLSFSLSMAATCRPTNLFIIPVVGWGIYYLFRNTDIFKKAQIILLFFLGLIPLGLQLQTWKLLSGSYVYYSYGEERFNWLQPQFFQVLLSSRHGLFFWSPLLIFSAIAVVIFLANPEKIRSLKLFFSLIIFSACILWYFNACWHMWWFGDAFGGRAFLELTFLFVTGITCFIQWVFSQSSRIRALYFSLIGLCITWNYLLMALYITKKISRSDSILWF